MKNKQPLRAWQRMLSGRRLDLLDPSPLDIEIEDIAHGLARVARWNGQTTGDHALSVAQHALIVEEIFTACRPLIVPPADAHKRQTEQGWQLAALLHDAPEYVIGDMISPFKNALGLDYKAFEQRLQIAIHRRFSLPDTLPVTIARAIKQADLISAYFEATRLAGFSEREAAQFFGQIPQLPATLKISLENLSPMPAPQAQRQFLDRHSNLTKSCLDKAV